MKVKAWDRDIICIPQSRQSKRKGGNVSYPLRGQYRANLAKWGLIGKLHLTSSMTDEEVCAEVRSVFAEAMGHDSLFPFTYLQGTGGGSKLLTIPSQSSSFKWTPQQVARLSGQSGTIYILAQAPLNIVEQDDHVVCIN